MTIDEMIAAGMGRVANTGAFSGGVVGGGAGDVLLIDEPELIIGIPAGYAMIPLRISCQVQPGAATTDADETEILIAVDSLGLWSGDGTSTPESPSNMRTDLDKGSALRVGSAVTGAITTTPGFAVPAPQDPVLDMELAREVQTLELATAVGQNLYLVRLTYEPKHPPIIVGPATLLVYFGGTVATVGGFVQAAWVEGTKREILEARAA